MVDRPKKMVDGVVVDLTDAEIAQKEQREAEWAIELEKRAASEYQQERIKKYPQAGDQFDRLFKFLKDNQAVLEMLGFEMTEVNAYINDVQKVKDEIPKPGKRSK